MHSFNSGAPQFRLVKIGTIQIHTYDRIMACELSLSLLKKRIN